MALYRPGSSSRAQPLPGKSEFEILKESHKFLREEDRDDRNLTWDQQLAHKYYDSLYREFAVCDLKHYKSGHFALRWRTEDEVLSGAGETTCGNTRCEHHNPPRYQDIPIPSLTTLELPFAYVEHGENKAALVKVVLCGKCLKKLMWKRQKEKERLMMESGETVEQTEEPRGHSPEPEAAPTIKREEEETELGGRGRDHMRPRAKRSEDETGRRRERSSRSRSPRHRDQEVRNGAESRRRRSPHSRSSRRREAT